LAATGSGNEGSSSLTGIVVTASGYAITRKSATGGRVRGVLAWMDLEMTGLDAGQHVIVEMATLLTTDDLEIIAEGPDLVIHASEEQLATMGDFVTAMHTSSGLLEEIRSSTLTLDAAVEQTLAFLRTHIDEPGTIPLCGNSIGTDRRFLVRHAPVLEDFFHYRSVDVSTIKELARRWNPEALKEVPEKSSNHRALDDIRASVEELRAYRTLLFVPPAS
jgi:oligoribonuclease